MQGGTHPIRNFLGSWGSWVGGSGSWVFLGWFLGLVFSRKKTKTKGYAQRLVQIPVRKARKRFRNLRGGLCCRDICKFHMHANFVQKSSIYFKIFVTKYFKPLRGDPYAKFVGPFLGSWVGKSDSWVFLGGGSNPPKN